MQSPLDRNQLKIDQFYLHNRVCTILGGGGGSLLFKNVVKFVLSIKKSPSFDRLPTIHPLKQSSLLQNLLRHAAQFPL